MFPRISSLHDSLRRLRQSAGSQFAALPSLGGMRTIASLVSAVLFVAVFYLVQSSNTTYLAQTVRQKEARIEALKRENSQYRFEISAASSPKGIEERASRLGLRPAKHVVYVNIPALQGDERWRMVSFAPRLTVSASQGLPPEQTSMWDQVLAAFGLADGGRAQARTR